MSECKYYKKVWGRTKCSGTKNFEDCSCGGDRDKCTFYPDVKTNAEEIKEENQKEKTSLIFLPYEMLFKLRSINECKENIPFLTEKDSVALDKMSEILRSKILCDVLHSQLAILKIKDADRYVHYDMLTALTNRKFERNACSFNKFCQTCPFAISASRNNAPTGLLVCNHKDNNQRVPDEDNIYRHGKCDSSCCPLSSGLATESMWNDEEYADVDWTGIKKEDIVNNNIILVYYTGENATTASSEAISKYNKRLYGERTDFEQMKKEYGIIAVPDSNEVANKFYDFLISNGYKTETDKSEDINDMIIDFAELQKCAPKLFNLFKEIF